ncbi:hypothetical protein BH11ARM2_BH11ARM2_00700 [soil metagenome]
MRESELFALGLGIVSPWKVGIWISTRERVHVGVDFDRGARFDGRSVYDTRREEAKRFKELTGTRWMGLKNPGNLTRNSR